ncbi:MAG: class I SAM-dependent methyltransferase [Betaproteobacteria bacterium]|nr:class I SAM-dependent methyltransferase [Betaproteobacteria bacterium]
MASIGPTLHLMIDGSLRAVLKTRQGMMGSGAAGKGLGASLPGGQVFLAAEVVRDRDGFELLRSGDTKHSMWRTVEWRLLREALANAPRPLLDLGCGDGGFGALLTNSIEYGIDGDADAVSQCNPKVYGSTHAADMRQSLPLTDRTIATIFSNSTLEHVEPLAPAIASIARALRPGGRLLATVPTSGFTETMVAAYGTPFAERLNRTLGHHNLWSWSRWEELRRSNGFSAVSFRGYLSRPAIVWYCSRGLAPWPQIARRRRDWLWQHDLNALRHHVDDSLRVTAEQETTCVLIDAVRS